MKDVGFTFYHKILANSNLKLPWKKTYEDVFVVLLGNIYFVQLSRVNEKKNISCPIYGTLLSNFEGKSWIHFSELISEIKASFSLPKILANPDYLGWRNIAIF